MDKIVPRLGLWQAESSWSVASRTQPSIEPHAGALLFLQHISSKNLAKVAAAMDDGRRADPTRKGPRTDAPYPFAPSAGSRGMANTTLLRQF
jgi:hypothetical protein